jgi:hypothetical protein
MGMVIEPPQAGDEVISQHETPLLIVDGAVASSLTDMVVDYRDVTDDHQSAGGFVLRAKLPDE